MKLTKPLGMIFAVTILSLVYVHQQVELVKLSYCIDAKEKVLKDMLDRRDGLGYNIANLQDPSRLEKVLLSKNINVMFPKNSSVFGSSRYSFLESRDSIQKAGVEKRLFFGIFDFLGLTREAQAKEHRLFGGSQ